MSDLINTIQTIKALPVNGTINTDSYSSKELAYQRKRLVKEWEINLQKKESLNTTL